MSEKHQSNVQFISANHPSDPADVAASVLVLTLQFRPAWEIFGPSTDRSELWDERHAVT
jgi:hypothetical protein